MEVQHFGELTRGELRNHAMAGGVLVIPLGALEQHGPHLPTCTDAAIAEKLLLRATEITALPCPLVIAPTFVYGSSDHHLPFGGTLSISTQTYLSLLMDLGRSAAASGFSRLLFFNGHGGNHELANLAARDLSLAGLLQVACGSWWQIAAKELREWAECTGRFVPGHAGALETSLALTLFPELVETPPRRADDELARQRAQRDTTLRIDLELTRIDGYTDDPWSAAPDQPLVEAIATSIAREIEHFEHTTRQRSR